MKTVKVRIFRKNEDSMSKIVRFLSNPDNSKEFSLKMNRDKAINDILSISSECSSKWLPSLQSLSPILLDHKFGSIYQSKYREIINLSTISHNIKYITVENNILFGIIDILDTPYGNPIQSIDPEDIILKPIYSNISDEIVTFDIDFNIKTT